MIRSARDADAPALAALQSLLAAPSPRLLTAASAAGTCLVSVPDDPQCGRSGAPVGYVLTVGDDDSDAHVAELVVHPEYRRAGHGRALLRAVVARQAPGTRVTIAVAADNDPARSLYESAGFRQAGRRPGFYESVTGVADDAVVYAQEVGVE